MIIDDHARFRQGGRDRRERESDIDVVADCASREEGLQAVQELQPDVVILDIRPLLPQEVNQVQGGRLPHVGYICFVGHAEAQHARAF